MITQLEERKVVYDIRRKYPQQLFDGKKLISVVAKAIASVKCEIDDGKVYECKEDYRRAIEDVMDMFLDSGGVEW